MWLNLTSVLWNANVTTPPHTHKRHSPTSAIAPTHPSAPLSALASGRGGSYIWDVLPTFTNRIHLTLLPWGCWWTCYGDQMCDPQCVTHRIPTSLFSFPLSASLFPFSHLFSTYVVRLLFVLGGGTFQSACWWDLKRATLFASSCSSSVAGRSP